MEDLVERKIVGLAIRIDRMTCISTGNCMKVASDVFEFDAEKICAFKEVLENVDWERLIEACSVCPVDALIAIDEGGNRLIP